MIGVVDREQVIVEEERLVLQSENWHEKQLICVVGVYIWICVLDYLNKTQDSRSFGAKPPCQDLMKI